MCRAREAATGTPRGSSCLLTPVRCTAVVTQPKLANSLAELFRQRLELLRGKGLLAVARNSGWVLFEHVYRAVLAAVIAAWVARYLGPGRYATLAYGVALTAFLGPVVQLGTNTIIVRDLARLPDKAAEIIGTAISLRLAVGFVGLCLAALVLLWTTQSFDDWLIGMLIAGQLVFQAAEPIDLFFQSRLESRYGVRSRAVITLLMAVVRVALIIGQMPLWTFALALGIEFAGIAVALVVAYRAHPASVPLTFSRRRAAVLLRESAPFLLSGLAIAGYMRFDHILIRELINPHALGLYAAVIALSQAWHFVPMSLVTSLAPHVAKAADLGEEVYRRTLRAAFAILGGLSMAIALGIAIFAGPAVKILLGPDYAPAVPVLRVYGITNIAVALGTAWNIWATISGQGRLLLLNTVVGSIVSVVANLSLIPRYGIFGAAIAANLSFFTSALFMNFFTCRDIFYLQIGLLRRGRISPL